MLFPKGRWLLGVLLIGGLASCSDSDSDKRDQPLPGGDSDNGVGVTDPDQDGSVGVVEDFASSEAFFSNMDTMVAGASPHGSVKIFYSQSVKDLVAKDSFEAPEGTVSIKPFDNDGEEGVDGFAVMVKKGADYDPENQNWYYEMRDASGALMEEPAPGKISMCIGCHAKGQETDYLLGTKLGLEDMMAPGFVEDFASSESFFTKMPGLVEGSSPHGKAQIYYSTNVMDLIEEDSFLVPEGTVSIKPFDNNGEDGIDGFAVMVKKGEDYDPENQNWYYEMRDADGVLLDMPAPGKTPMCIGCHASGQDTDYLLGTRLGN